jgi:hypothetical protein
MTFDTHKSDEGNLRVQPGSDQGPVFASARIVRLGFGSLNSQPLNLQFHVFQALAKLAR